MINSKRIVGNILGDKYSKNQKLNFENITPGFPIDEDIIPILNMVNSRPGVRTLTSCSGRHKGCTITHLMIEFTNNAASRYHDELEKYFKIYNLKKRKLFLEKHPNRKIEYSLRLKKGQTPNDFWNKILLVFSK